MNYKDIDANFDLALEKAIASLAFPQEVPSLIENLETKGNLTNKDKETLYQYHRHLQKVLPASMAVDLEGDRIVIHFADSTTEPTDNPADYTPYMQAIMEYMDAKGMTVKPFPKITLKEDLIEGSWVFGKTAYYDQGLQEIVLYTSNRHPKDILRSFAHEMIHHQQNLEGRIGEGKIYTNNVNEDDYLRKLEEEAYLQGNMTFREWTDSITSK